MKINIWKIAILLVSLLGLTGCAAALETNTYEVTDSFADINIQTDTADVVFVPTDEDFRVVCYDKKNVKHTVEVVEGRLEIKVVDNRAFYQKIFNFADDKIMIYMPEAEYASLVVKSDTADVEIPKNFKFGNANVSTDTGEIEIDGITCDSLAVDTDTGDVSLEDITSSGEIRVSADTGDVELEGCVAAKLTVSSDTGNAELENCQAPELSVTTDTGKVDLNKISCENLNAKTATGNIIMRNAIASGKIYVLSDTGDVKFDACDAAEIFVETDAGDVRGSFISDKIIFAETKTGDVDVPKLTSGGRCEITTDTGDIKITIN